jgi:hypothetical protein
MLSVHTLIDDFAFLKRLRCKIIKMSNEKTFANEIADLCLDYFERVIPGKGKPQPGVEWTVLSAIVQENDEKSVRQVVAMGTGTKCLGENEVSPGKSFIKISVYPP